MNKRTKDFWVAAAVGAGVVFVLIPGSFWFVSKKWFGSTAEKAKATKAGEDLKKASE